MATAIELHDVRKRFIIRHEAARSLQGAVLGLLGRREIASEEFWALDGISLGVERGETLGIIGPNGSGKSTILKLLARTIRPTSGQVVVNGSVFGLLDLGAGMHPDLSGRENIFLNGAFVGLNRRRIQDLYKSIVDFAELERFIDTPVKHYSSGMYMRLGFAIAINVDPDILLIDEVLAVGDAHFAAKCYEALSEVKRRGRTIVFISHDPVQVRRFCDRVMWLDNGCVRAIGEPRDVIPEYLRIMRGAAPVADRADHDIGGDRGTGEVRVRAAIITDPQSGREQYAFLPGTEALIRIELETDHYFEAVVVGCAIRRSDGLLVAETSTATSLGQVALVPGRTLVECGLGPLPLGPGTYHVSLAVWPAADRSRPFHVRSDAFTIFMGKAIGTHRGVAVVPSRWRVSADSAFESIVPDEAPIPQPDMLTETPQVLWADPPSVIEFGSRDEDCLGSGWYPVENWPPRVRWTADRATAYLRQEPGQGSLTLDLCRPLHAADSVRVHVTVNGAELAAFSTHGMDFEAISIPLDPVDAARTLEVRIDVDNMLVPAAVGLDTDTRSLGVAVRSLRVE